MLAAKKLLRERRPIVRTLRLGADQHDGAFVAGAAHGLRRAHSGEARADHDDAVLAHQPRVAHARCAVEIARSELVAGDDRGAYSVEARVAVFRRGPARPHGTFGERGEIEIVDLGVAEHRADARSTRARRARAAASAVLSIAAAAALKATARDRAARSAFAR